jgi:hypothetical protein
MIQLWAVSRSAEFSAENTQNGGYRITGWYQVSI